MPKINTFTIPEVSDDLALLLGMFAGDGCLPVSHNGDGNRIYPISFFNTQKEYVDLFAELFMRVFEVKGTISKTKRKKRKDLWMFYTYSIKLYEYFLYDLEIANGKKALHVRIPSFIMNGSNSLKIHFFFGLLITDGSLRAKDDMIFHVASKDLAQDLLVLIKEVWGFERWVNSYLQKGAFSSYQIYLNKQQSSFILQNLPSSHNLVLR